MYLTNIFLLLMNLCMKNILVAGNPTHCKLLSSAFENNFNYTQIAGQWYLRASSDYVFNHGRNFSASAEIQNGAVKWHGNGIKVKSTIEEHEYNALWTFPDEHSPEYTAKLEGILSVFSGNYTVVNMDAECFIFIQGCPKQFDRDLVAIFFREQNPNQECKDAFSNALQKSGLSTDNIIEDPSIV